MRTIQPGYIAIDPGASGGIAWVDRNGVVQADDLEMGVQKLCEIKANFPGSSTLYIEDVPYGMAQGGFLSPMAKLHRSAGRLEGAAVALGIRMIMVKPQRWQKALGLGARRNHGKDWKKHLRDEAQRRFPELTVTLKTADALLILDYAMQGGIT